MEQRAPALRQGGYGALRLVVRCRAKDVGLYRLKNDLAAQIGGLP